jgi:hypothetical protein
LASQSALPLPWGIPVQFVAMNVATRITAFDVIQQRCLATFIHPLSKYPLYSFSTITAKAPRSLINGSISISNQCQVIHVAHKTLKDEFIL